MPPNTELDDVSEEIWRKWMLAEGSSDTSQNPCSGCPCRDPHQQYVPKNIDPGWHSGCANADVLLVGLEPSDSYPDVHKNRPGGFLEYYDSNDGFKDVHGFLFFNRDEPTNRRIHPAFLDTLRGEFYYTNSQKCGMGPNQEARKNCMSHLAKQIEAISPDVIIPIGRASTNAMREELGRLNIGDETAYYEIVLEPHRPDEGATPVVLPSYHWSYFNQSANPIPNNIREKHDVSNVEEYWVRLAEQANSIIQ